MKRVILFIVFCTLIFTGCDYQKPEPIDLKSERLQIETVLEQFVVANETQDFELIEKIWADDENIILIGTDSDERLVGWNMIERSIKHQFSEFQETFITVSDQLIRLNGSCNSACFSELLAYNFIYKEEAMSFTGMRFTGVLEKVDDRWVLVQGHLSIPAEVEMNEVY